MAGMCASVSLAPTVAALPVWPPLYPFAMGSLPKPPLLPGREEAAACGIDATTPGPVSAGTLLDAIAQERSGTAFEQLFDRYAGRLKHFFVSGGIDVDRAEELVQEVLLAVWRRSDTFDQSRASALTWIYSMARNRRIDEFRARGHAEPRAEDLAWDSTRPPASTERAVERSRHRDALGVALVALPEEQRTVLERTFYDGLSLAEIAVENGLPLGTVKSRARLALARLRKALRPNEDAP